MGSESAVALGAVIIGRNEGERLRCCLRSALSQMDAVVYVDSGSSDGSVDFARSLGVEALCLNMSLPFNAGRARNEGVAVLRAKYPQIRYIQFIDGDCELCDGWIAAASAFLDSSRSYAIATGRLKERFPDRTIYNRLCDIEWATPAGDTNSCGGIFMIRAEAFASVGGFNATMIAGEEPELCFRIRAAGWRLFAIDRQMALHDADIRHFAQWWKRKVRSGYAYANAFHLYRKDPGGGYHGRQTARIWLWAFAVPVIVAAGAGAFGLWGLATLLLYPAQVFRISIAAPPEIKKRKIAFLYAIFNVLEKFPCLIGQLVFIKRSVLSERAKIMEYK